ncbi:MAG: protoporphyrinogen oxidase, partial [Bacteroidota bacterium]
MGYFLSYQFMIAIIGAGINGLALGYELQKRNIPYQILEATQRVGGCINSQKVEKYWLELGPNSLLCNAEVNKVINEIGLRDQVIEANEISNSRYIFKKGRYQKLPAKPQQLLFSPFFSFKTKLAVFREFRNKSKGSKDETLSSFFRRRFSQEVVDYPLNTFVAGIYAGDPDKLLLRKAFPVLKRYEEEYGSILRGFIKNKTGERRQSVSFQKGIAQLPRTMAEKLNIRLQTPVQSISKNENGRFILQLPEGETLEA